MCSQSYLPNQSIQLKFLDAKNATHPFKALLAFVGAASDLQIEEANLSEADVCIQ